MVVYEYLRRICRTHYISYCCYLWLLQSFGPGSGWYKTIIESVLDPDSRANPKTLRLRDLKVIIKYRHVVRILDGSSEHGAVIQVFRPVEGILLHRKRCVKSDFFRKIPTLLHTCATFSELPSHISTMR